LIVDEAHATGVVGPQGAGLVQQLGLSPACFARINTFGKAVGCHGAIVLGSARLRDYLVNFSRSLIYSTAMPESSAAAIRSAYAVFPGMEAERAHLQQLIQGFQQADCAWEKLPSQTPIQVIVVPGNDRVKQVAEKIQGAGLDVRPIMYPTVPAGKERLRIVLHAFNTREELEKLLSLLS
jgi:8-amino-7-oxononanoate synthase